MAITRNKLEKNLQKIRDNIAEACSRSGRSAAEVRIVAITKTVDLEAIKCLLDVGLVDLGENRIQQLQDRAEKLSAYLPRRRNPLPSPVRWHMVGHLQRNKVKAAVRIAEVIHSVDSLRLAEDLNARAEQADKTLDVMLQVNCSQELQKSGCAVGAAGHLGEMVSSLKRLRLIGLMTMAPLVEDPELARPSFVRLRELFEEMRAEGVGGDDFLNLSMGMSQDYTIAVEEGATTLRIGTALFA